MKNFIYWFPRIFNIALIVFLALLSLDVFGNDLTLGATLLALFVHLIPSVILTFLLLYSWKNGLVGAIGFVFITVCYFLLINSGGSSISHLLFPLLFLLIALFYAIDWRINYRGKLAVR